MADPRQFRDGAVVDVNQVAMLTLDPPLHHAQFPMQPPRLGNGWQITAHFTGGGSRILWARPEWREDLREEHDAVDEQAARSAYAEIFHSLWPNHTLSPNLIAAL